MLRGQIITSFAQVEFLLADFSVKTRLLLPYKIKNRIQAVKDIIAHNATFKSYEAELTPLADQLVSFEDLRNFMAHGFLSIHTDKINQHMLEYRLYIRTNKDKFQLETVQTTLDKLLADERAITAIHPKDGDVIPKNLYRVWDGVRSRDHWPKPARFTWPALLRTGPRGQSRSAKILVRGR
jgi:hypothetical protein